jgi:hypothetical protein
MSLPIRQNCHPEVSYPMHIVDAIAFKLKALRCAKVMITHMGFHAMGPDAPGQGRAAQLVNPLRANSLFADPVMIAERVKSLVAGCDDGATRRSAERPPAGQPAWSGSAVVMDRFSSRGRPCADVDRPVQRHWLAWTELCAPEPAAPGRPAAAGATRAPGRARARSGFVPPMGGPGPLLTEPHRPRSAADRKYLASKPAADRNHSGKSGPGTVHCPIDFENMNARPSIRAAGCTCPAQFTRHSAVGVIR